MGTRFLKARWQYLDDLVDGIRHYKDYLCMMKNMQHWVGEPPLGVHLAWHVHMMHPERYQAFTTTYLGRLLEHHDEHEGVSTDSKGQNDVISTNAFMRHRDPLSTSASPLQATVSFEHVMRRVFNFAFFFFPNLASALL